MWFKSIYLKTLRDYRIAILGWGGGMGLLMYVVLVAVPSLVATPQARASVISLGSSFSWIAEPIALGTPGGYVTWKYGLALLLIAIWPLMVCSRLLRGEEERGSLDALLSLPRGRGRVALEKLAAVWTALLGIGLLIAIILVAIELRVLRYAYEKVGLTRRSAMMVVLLSLFGSYINIPIAELSPEPVVSNEVVEFAGVRYIIPEVEQWPRTILAVNVGGAIVPTFVSIYLLVRNRLFFRGLIATALVTAVVHQLAQPVRGAWASPFPFSSLLSQQSPPH